jgi:predicted nucleotidyltransferase
VGGGGLERIIEKRRALRNRAIEVARQFAECASSRLGKIVAVLHGSYARGDFGEWSDVDVLVVVKGSLPKSPLERLDLVEDCLAKAPEIEPVIITLEEFKVLLKKNDPLVVGALKEGVLLIGNLQDLVREASSSKEPEQHSKADHARMVNDKELR